MYQHKNKIEEVKKVCSNMYTQFLSKTSGTEQRKNKSFDDESKIENQFNKVKAIK